MNKCDNKSCVHGSDIKWFFIHKPTYSIIPYPFLELHNCKTSSLSNLAAGPINVCTSHLCPAQSAGSVLYTNRYQTSWQKMEETNFLIGSNSIYLLLIKYFSISLDMNMIMVPKFISFYSTKARGSLECFIQL